MEDGDAYAVVFLPATPQHNTSTIYVISRHLAAKPDFMGIIFSLQNWSFEHSKANGNIGPVFECLQYKHHKAFWKIRKCQASAFKKQQRKIRKRKAFSNQPLTLLKVMPGMVHCKADMSL